MASDEGPIPEVTRGMVRRLAVILSADAAGYSRLMGDDEEETIRTITAYQAVIDTLVRQHHGRVVDSPGDNLLAEFVSIVDAVQCAVAIQQELRTRNTNLPVQRRMQFRIGITLADVIHTGERIYGDGVNIAARLEGLAEAGGICISGTIYDQIATKLPLSYEFLGEQTVKNIANPVRAYRIHTEPASPGLRRRPWGRRGAARRRTRSLWVVGLLLILGSGIASWQFFYPLWTPPAVAPGQQAAALALPDKPSIAVLPFVNMSEDPTQEYFSDGMTEDLITDLSRLAGLFVIARNSVFTYKGKPVKPERVRQELGVRYVLEGSVRRAKDRVRITAQLIDTTTGYHLWAERYDRELQDIFAVQEEIARRITRALAVRLTAEERGQMEQKYTNSVEAWDLFMRGMSFYRQYTKDANEQARQLFEEAIRLDPQFVRAYASLSATHRQDWSVGWAKDPRASEDAAYTNAKIAVDLAQQEQALASSLPYALQQQAYVLMYRGQHAEAIERAKATVDLDQNYADGYAVWAQVLIYAGEPEQAIELMAKAMRLNPNSPAYYHYHKGQAYYVMGKYPEAIESLQRALDISDKFRPARSYLVAALSESGQKDAARYHMDILRSMGRPPASDEYVKRIAPYKDQAIAKRLQAIWQEAGVRVEFPMPTRNEAALNSLHKAWCALWGVM